MAPSRHYTASRDTLVTAHGGRNDPSASNSSGCDACLPSLFWTYGREAAISGKKLSCIATSSFRCAYQAPQAFPTFCPVIPLKSVKKWRNYQCERLERKSRWPYCLGSHVPFCGSDLESVLR